MRSPLLALALCLAAPSVARADPPPASASAIERVSFREAVARALARGPTLAVAQADLRRARALVEQARAASLPTVALNGVYTRLDDDRVLNGRVITGANTFAGNLQVVLPLVAPGAWGRWSRSGDGVDVAMRSVDEARRQLAASAARVYLSLASQHRIVATIERSRDNARAHVDFAHERVTGGVGTRLDEVRAAQDHAAATLQLANARATLARLQEALGVVTGSDRPLDGVDDAEVAATPEADAALTAAAGRTDVRVAEARVAQAQHASRDSWLDYMPAITATFQPYAQDPASLVNPVTGWQLQVVLSAPLFDGGLRYGLAHERRALLEQARVTLDAVIRQARADVRGALAAITHADEALSAARESAALAHEALSLAEEAWRAGANTNLDVIDAQRRARDADAATHAAEDNAQQARLELLIAAGRFP